MRIVALVLVAVGLGLLLAQQRDARAQENRFAAIASEIAGREVSVHCQGRVGAALDVTWEDGTVRFDAQGRPADYTDLKRRVCVALDAFADDPTRANERQLSALNTLAHEAWHLAGVMNEAETQCRAMQTIALVAGRLGADALLGQQLALRYEHEVYPRLRAEYQTPSCRDGSPLDLRPTDPVWP